jgi:nucleoside-diphosphate-sugar epimerase
MNGSIFITGGSGNTGQALLARLAEDKEIIDAGITCLARPGGRRDNLERFPVRIVKGDSSDAASLGRAYGGEPTVIHIASLFHAGAVLEACGAANRLIAISSTGVFSRYRRLASKIAAAEKTIEESGLAYTMLRPTMIYGTPADRNISRLIRFVNRSRVIPLPAGGRSIFQPVHVDDLASCIIAALKCKASTGRTYNVPGGSAHTLREIVSIIAELLGRPVSTIPVPFVLADLAAGLYEHFASRPKLRREQILRLREDKSYDHTEAARDLGYEPMTFREGISRQLAAMNLGRG